MILNIKISASNYINYAWLMMFFLNIITTTPLKLDSSNQVQDTSKNDSEINISIKENFVVKTNDDGGTGSLRMIVSNASSGDTIRFDRLTDEKPIRLTSGNILLLEDLVLIGNGVSKTIISGGNNSRIFFIQSNSYLSSLTLIEGNGEGGLSGQGGAMINFGDTFLINCFIAKNSSSFIGGGILNRGTLYMKNCTIADNSAVVGGGFSNNFGAATLINCTIARNIADDSGKSGGILNSGDLSLFNTIVAENHAIRTPDICNSSSIIDGGNNLIGDGIGQSTLINGLNHNQVGSSTMPVVPLFKIIDNNSLTVRDFILGADSPAIDKGNNSALPQDLGDLDGDSNFQEPLPLDILESQRIINDIVDIGAYEFDPYTANAKPLPIPTLQFWGLLILSLFIIILTSIALNKKQYFTNYE